MLLPLLLCILCIGLNAQEFTNSHHVDFPPEKFLTVGDPCTLPFGVSGVCSFPKECPEVSLNADAYKPFICSFNHRTPIICCPRVSCNTSQPGSVSNPQIGDRSRKGCEENLKVLQNITPNAPDYTLDSFGTKPVLPGEFPFMAVIGFGKENKIYWRCSGALVHKRYVLAPGHCVASRRHGAVKWVLLGAVDLYGSTGDSSRQLFVIEKRIAHPGFKPPSIYDDLSLLKLDRDAVFNPNVRPACINTNPDLQDNFGEVAGWELDDWVIVRGKSQMMKVLLPVQPAQECINAHRSLLGGPKLQKGYSEDMMICVGDKQGGFDTCERDTGGPYLRRSPEYPNNLHVIAAITLFGKTTCGGVNTPSIAVKVTKYLPWIEDTIWPL